MYNPKTWVSLEHVEASSMNRIEQGIADNQYIFKVFETYTKNGETYVHATYADIYNQVKQKPVAIHDFNNQYGEGIIYYVFNADYNSDAQKYIASLANGGTTSFEADTYNEDDMKLSTR